ncbi:hypothetical protein [Microbacterium dauci]|uniref:HK97 gp10 family phage protein n=1 Tax=Microbacterium dauci TaxID=3048008 RepID=A0ABT6ZGU5_9MICO|nr:hypothetical protein [Microbacterium sp. LX3-4]MDJ1115386.1 hypothetical protein [Microbacterium sp. LX3-4]
MASGRISLLVDSPLRDMLIAARGLPAEVRKQIGVQTKAAAEPIWFGETRDRAGTRLQQRALVNPARVGVTARNVFLRSGSVGKLASGTPVSAIAKAAEFGADPTKQITQRSRKGNRYSRRLGNAFGIPRRGGNTFHPAARDSIPRFAALWVQTAVRTALDALELKGK